MKYALFEAVKDKSNSDAYRRFQQEALALLSKAGRSEGVFHSIVLCNIPNDTVLFGDLISHAQYSQIAYRVLYFQDDPVVFSSQSYK